MTDGTILSHFPAPGPAPLGLAWDGECLWVSDRKERKIFRADPKDGHVLFSIAFDGELGGCGWDGKFVWQADQHSRTISQIDPGDRRHREGDPRRAPERGADRRLLRGRLALVRARPAGPAPQGEVGGRHVHPRLSDPARGVRVRDRREAPLLHRAAGRDGPQDGRRDGIGADLLPGRRAADRASPTTARSSGWPTRS